MALRRQEIQANAVRFSKKWAEAFNEEAQAQSFQREFFAVFGQNVNEIGDYESRDLELYLFSQSVQARIEEVHRVIQSEKAVRRLWRYRS